MLIPSDFSRLRASGVTSQKAVAARDVWSRETTGFEVTALQVIEFAPLFLGAFHGAADEALKRVWSATCETTELVGWSGGSWHCRSRTRR